MDYQVSQSPVYVPGDAVYGNSVILQSEASRSTQAAVHVCKEKYKNKCGKELNKKNIEFTATCVEYCYCNSYGPKTDACYSLLLFMVTL